MTAADTERTPLSRDRIATAALAYIDEHGADALSMRKLGSSLGVEAMSLYNHVANKDDVLDAVAEVVYRELLDEYEPSGVDWMDDARNMARAWRRAAHRHPNAFDLIADRPFAALDGLQVFAHCYAIFTVAGLETNDAALAFDTAASWVVGSIRQEMGLMVALAQGSGFDPADAPPEFRDVADFKAACLSWSADERFERGLEVVLAGIRATFDV